MNEQPPPYPNYPPTTPYQPPPPYPWPPQQPYSPQIIMTTYGPNPPRQSCAIHALLLVTTFGVGNIAYAIWHSTRHN